jgi:hypothetical protein
MTASQYPKILTDIPNLIRDEPIICRLRLPANSRAVIILPVGEIVAAFYFLRIFDFDLTARL